MAWEEYLGCWGEWMGGTEYKKEVAASRVKRRWGICLCSLIGVNIKHWTLVWLKCRDESMFFVTYILLIPWSREWKFACVVTRIPSANVSWLFLYILSFKRYSADSVENPKMMVCQNSLEPFMNISLEPFGRYGWKSGDGLWASLRGFYEFFFRNIVYTLLEILRWFRM